VLLELGVQCEILPIDLMKGEQRGEQRTAEFLGLNPNGRVPVLIDDDLTLWDLES
jgi:glutathione S-transferase